MADYDNTNKGSLFKNDKGDNPNRPDYQGKINVKGEEFRLSAWIQTPKSGGNKYLAINVSDIVAKNDFAPKAPTTCMAAPEENDDIPF